MVPPSYGPTRRPKPGSLPSYQQQQDFFGRTCTRRKANTDTVTVARKTANASPSAVSPASRSHRKVPGMFPMRATADALTATYPSRYLSRWRGWTQYPCNVEGMGRDCRRGGRLNKNKVSNVRVTYLLFFLILYFVSVDSPTGPHPPLRLARRPNRGHIGGGGWTPSCGTCQ